MPIRGSDSTCPRSETMARSVFVAFIILALIGRAEAQTAPFKIAEIGADAGATNSGGTFPPTTGTKFILGFPDGPSVSSPLLPSPLVISNVTFDLNHDNTPGFDDLIAMLT